MYVCTNASDKMAVKVAPVAFLFVSKCLYYGWAAGLLGCRAAGLIRFWEVSRLRSYWVSEDWLFSRRFSCCHSWRFCCGSNSTNNNCETTNEIIFIQLSLLNGNWIYVIANKLYPAMSTRKARLTASPGGWVCVWRVGWKTLPLPIE